MSIVLEGLTKRVQGRTLVEDFSLEIRDGELFVFLGASGSGKSTVLRMIAGLASADGGSIRLKGRDVTGLPPQERGVGFVFQNYSVFQHMSASDNIAFGLRIRGVRARERRRRSEELLDLVGLGGLGDRYPRQLSGGQQQRVALARALAYEPQVLLLDEPFGALDVQIRTQLRRAFLEVQRRLRVTTILVTHDQEEAFEMADRIGIVERGRLVEVGDAERLYGRPGTYSAATFLGSGTVLVGRCRGGQAEFGGLVLPVPEDLPHEEGAPVRVLIRPEQVAVEAEPTAGRPVLGRGTLVESRFAGALRRVRLAVPRLARTRQIAPPLPYGETDLRVDAVVAADSPMPPEAWLTLTGWRILEQPRPTLLVADALRGTDPPVAAARALSSALGASMVVLGVVPPTRRAETLQSRLKSRFESDALEVRVRSGQPAEQIRNEQAESFYDLVVLGEAGRKALRGGAIQQILRQSTTPVLFGKPRRDVFERILICTAVGEPGKNDVRVGGWLASRLGAAVTLLHVAREEGPAPAWVRNHLDRGIATLTAFDVDARPRIAVAPTPLAGILTEAAEGNYDLVVIGAHGPRRRSVTARDDVSLRILERAGRPVLIVPDES